MEQIIRRKVVVQQGGSIELRSDELKEGTEAEVIVIVQSGAESKPVSYASLFGSGRGGFGSAQEADDFLRRERDSWEN